MYLLIRNLDGGNFQNYNSFTSHYVSINSGALIWEAHWNDEFTSHYVSINSNVLDASSAALRKFTSHYVSINSDKAVTGQLTVTNLHPTMYLLIPGGQGHHSAGQNDLHPTMYLLIRIYFF